MRTTNSSQTGSMDAAKDQRPRDLCIHKSVSGNDGDDAGNLIT